jgi:hypothetical protein
LHPVEVADVILIETLLPTVGDNWAANGGNPSRACSYDTGGRQQADHRQAEYEFFHHRHLSKKDIRQLTGALISLRLHCACRRLSVPHQLPAVRAVQKIMCARVFLRLAETLLPRMTFSSPKKSRSERIPY